jgi:hypothetical protein
VRWIRGIGTLTDDTYEALEWLAIALNENDSHVGRRYLLGARAHLIRKELAEPGSLLGAARREAPLG